jgi:hypothetical protein
MVILMVTIGGGEGREVVVEVGIDMEVEQLVEI